MTDLHIMQEVIDLAESIERKGAASNHFLRRVAAALRYLPKAHPSKRHAETLTEAILAGKAQPAELRAFADVLAHLEAA